MSILQFQKKFLTVNVQEKRTKCYSYENTYIKQLKSHIKINKSTIPRSAYNGQCQKCDLRRCMTCKNIQCTQKFSSTHTGEEFIIYCNANCRTENSIYLLECAICGLQYIGETEQQLSKTRKWPQKRCKLQT